MKLIPLDAVLAEIEDRIRACGNCYILDELTSLHLTIDSLEIKEVDLQEEAKRKWDSFSLCYDESRGCDVVVWPFWVYKQICKYFFELGLKAQKGE